MQLAWVPVEVIAIRHRSELAYRNTHIVLAHGFRVSGLACSWHGYHKLDYALQNTNNPPKGIEVRDLYQFYRFLSIFIDFHRILYKIMILYMEIGLG